MACQVVPKVTSERASFYLVVLCLLDVIEGDDDISKLYCLEINRRFPSVRHHETRWTDPMDLKIHTSSRVRDIVESVGSAHWSVT